MQNQIQNQNVVRTSKLGKLYDQTHKKIEESLWVEELVQNIKEDVEFCIMIEKSTLPIPCTLTKCKTKPLSVEEMHTVQDALKVEGMVARYVQESGTGHFVIEELL